MNRKTWNANPSRDLSYTSLVIDEQNRAHHSHRITDTFRFSQTPVNGNLASIYPDIEEEGVRQTLPRHYQVDTSTRTVFHDDFYKPKDGIAEFVEDPHNEFYAVRATPHMGMNELAPLDTRIRKLKPPYESPLAPGYYEPDPLGERATGLLTIEPGEVHHTVQYSRDPTRPSATFRSPPRGRTAPDIAKESASPPVVSRMTGPDFSVWTSKGCWAPREDRAIEADRWGKNNREVKPPAEERPQSVYTPTVTTEGHPNSCEAYTAARFSPAYKVAFSSGLPRTMALPLGIKPDTRLQVKTYDDITAARPEVGPGSYNPEAPRFRSSNVAYDTSTPYYSLASGTPIEQSSHGSVAALQPTTSLAGLLPPQLQQQLAAAGTLSLLTPPSAPGTPSNGRSRQASGLAPLIVSSGGASTGAAVGARSAPTSPSAQRAAAVRAERLAAAALLASVSGGGQGGGGGRSHSLARSPLGSSGMYGGGGGLGGQQPLDAGAGSGGDDDGSPRALQLPSPSWSRAQSAPASPYTAGGGGGGGGAVGSTSVTASMKAAQSKQFTKLVFLQRHTPCSSLLRSHLIVAADLRKERQRLRNPS